MTLVVPAPAPEAPPVVPPPAGGPPGVPGPATTNRRAVRARRRRERSRPWAVLAAVVAVAAAAPVAVVVAALVSPSGDTWAHLWATRLPTMLTSTLALVLVVGAGAGALGVGLAWLVSAYTFPLRRVASWALALPLAIPPYVLGFVAVASLGPTGPVGGWWRQTFGSRPPDVRTFAVAAAVLVLALYPYVYLLARAAFASQAPAAREVARTLGCGPVRAFARVALPLARPAIAGGVALVVAETLTDVGTVRIFNVQTVADGVFRTWYGLADREAATELAALLVGFALLVALAERAARGRARFDTGGAGADTVRPERLRGVKAGAALGVVGLVLTLALVLPVLRLATWAAEAVRRGVTASPTGGFAEHVVNALVLAGLVGAAVLVGAVLLAAATRFAPGPLVRLGAVVASTGYAVPGAVVALGVLTLAAPVDGAGRGLLVTGTLVGLVYALGARYLALAHHGVDAGLRAAGDAVGDAARTLGEPPWRVLWRVHLPLVRPALAVGGALVVLDVLKELPVTLLLRPAGFDTLSVWVWQLTSESRWVEAGLPALAIVVVAVVPVVLLLRALDAGHEVRL